MVIELRSGRIRTPAEVIVMSFRENTLAFFYVKNEEIYI